uniref:Secreted protein n=1 Tax=Rhodnius prolixus TaxID=13249 RepID=T1H821_RHOPR
MFESGHTAWLIVLVSAAVLATSPPHLAHITGVSRKIRMYMKNAYLQMTPDGMVSGAPDDQSPTMLELINLEIHISFVGSELKLSQTLGEYCSVRT